MVEPIAHGRLRGLDELHALLELPGHLGAHPLQLGRHALLQAAEVAPHAERELADLVAHRFLTLAPIGADGLDLTLEQLRDRLGRRGGSPELAQLPPRGRQEPEPDRDEDEYDRSEQPLSDHGDPSGRHRAASGDRRS